VRQLASIVLSDMNADRVRVSHAEAIRELQIAPAAGARLIAGIDLADGVATPIAHGLGRAPVFVRESCVRGAATTGRVDDVSRTAGYDRSKFIVLTANGWGATVTVDVLVM
jgi:hypothetical protein